MHEIMHAQHCVLHACIMPGSEARLQSCTALQSFNYIYHKYPNSIRKFCAIIVNTEYLINYVTELAIFPTILRIYQLSVHCLITMGT